MTQVKKNKKIIFFGTPLIAAKCLQALIDLGYNVPFIVCQPDKPVGRKKLFEFSEAKKLAIKKNIEVIQPENLSEIYEKIKKEKPDLILTCAYGKIIPEKILLIPKFKCVNVHASLLPKYRGGAPIHWAIINGDKKTGITLMFMEKGMDTGNIILKKEIEISINDNLDSLFLKMENLAYEIVFKNIQILFDKNIYSFAQDEKKVSFAPNIKRKDEIIDWNKDALVIFNHIRGLNSKIGAFSIYNKVNVKIYEVEITDKKSINHPGTIVDNNKKILVATKNFLLEIISLQMAGKKRIYKENISSISKNFKLLSKFYKENE